MTDKSNTIEDHNSLLIEEQAIKLEDLAVLMARQMPEEAIVSLLIAVIDDMAEIKGEVAVSNLVTDLHNITTEMMADYATLEVGWDSASSH